MRKVLFLALLSICFAAACNKSEETPAAPEAAASSADTGASPAAMAASPAAEASPAASPAQ